MKSELQAVAAIVSGQFPTSRDSLTLASVVSGVPIFQMSAISRAHSQLTIHHSLYQLYHHYQLSIYFPKVYQLVNWLTLSLLSTLSTLLAIR
jgi:hypothetical protein